MEYQPHSSRDNFNILQGSLIRTCYTLLFSLCIQITSSAAEQPNILWISAEDISAHLGCYGDPHAITPSLDKLAEEGVRYSHAFTTAGVCAPCRSGIITGMYQTTLGTQHMRGNTNLPPQVRPFPILLREAGYFCTNNSKQDYQFKTPKETWDESSGKAHWRNRKNSNQPFFSVFNFTGCHESGIASTDKYETVTKDLSDSERQDADELTTFPPYYPETKEAREDWKRNYELITALDHFAADLIAQLKEDGLYEKTIIFFWSDHGVGLPRAKRWLYDSGTHIPLIVRVPEQFRVDGQAVPGSVSDQLVSSIDFGPTVLNLSDVSIPDVMQGIPFLGRNLPPARDYVFGARDRMDERYDIIRMVRDHRFKYIRNYEPLKTYYQYMNTPEKGATMMSLRDGHIAGTLSPEAEAYFASTKPVEELYDCEADPFELNNLANDPTYADTLKKLREVHLAWVKETRDLGLVAEPILVEREKELGHRYGVLRGDGANQAADQIAETANLASSGPKAIGELTAALDHEDSAVRYWAATGLGNIGLPASDSKGALEAHLDDESPVVQIAVARALSRMNSPEEALPVLTKQLADGEQWERLHAAIVLDEMDELARPAIDSMHAALKPRPDLYADGKYVVRVINRALNQLEGTDRTVP
ncbi:sulfatase-like hydrolase/transferase [Thalassoglobus sp. JC818]|uniref:sulfatase-like hydrolase/transferase n=1 Tax=Thalassoglobus sp. JC818 TaxID=3232136 RepID=UPI003457CD70